MSVPSDIQTSQAEAHDDAHLWADHGSDFVSIAEGKPPSRIELARERMLICRLYLGLLRPITDDYGAAFAAQNDSLTIRTIGIYVFLRAAMCSPARPSQIAQGLKLPRGTVLRRLQELVKDGYVERVGNAYRVTDKGEHPGFAEQTAATNRHGHQYSKKAIRIGSSPLIAPQ
jgi:IclR-like helix-turn-helix domain-containing protein